MNIMDITKTAPAGKFDGKNEDTYHNDGCYFELLCDNMIVHILEFVGPIDVFDLNLARHFRHIFTLATIRVTLKPGTLDEFVNDITPAKLQDINGLSLDFTQDGLYEQHFGVLASVLEQNNSSRMESLRIYSNERLETLGLMNMSFKINSTLKFLDLSKNSINAAAGIELGKALAVNTSLIRLDLSHNRLRKNGLNEILFALQTNNCLQWLDVSDNSSVTETGECAYALANALRVNNTLEYLNIGENNIDNDGAVVIADSLNHNCTLKELNVFGQYILHQGIVAFAETLKKNTSVKVLDTGTVHAYLDPVFHGFQSGVSLGEALKVNNTLEELLLTNFNFGTEDAVRLSEGLKVNNSLRILNIRENAIGSKGIMALADALTCNTALKELNIAHADFDGGARYSDFDADAATEYAVCAYNALALALKKNSTLQKLWVGADNIKHEDGLRVIFSFADAVKKNLGLEELHINFEENNLQSEALAAFKETRKFNEKCRFFINDQEMLY